MIKINKIKEPEILELNCDQWTKDYLEYKNGRPGYTKTTEGKYRHRDIKEALIKETSGKCVYCESKILSVSDGDIEHILPKSKHYNLCFEWKNLTLACRICNREKSDYYSQNYPLVNPYTEDPTDHLHFAGALLIALSAKGKITLEEMKLNRLELLESRQRYLQKLESITIMINQSDEELKEILFKDLLSYCDEDREYSAMMKVYVETIQQKLTKVN
ncbi:HNH endonuclease [Sporosarcina sp. P34]|uniref:HNH endonuclease n=1 Tax=Sporosarcina sp. P34 TaxID=2048247 RepID=UPI001304301D|nr:HNH endonuclease [Sporosarcina sp. P34]